MQPTLPTTRTTARRGRAIAAGVVLIALMLLATATLALTPTPAYAAGDLFRLNADVTVGLAETYTSVVVMNGTIVVDGRVVKDAFAANGDIIVHDGGSIGGDAISLTGKVTTEGSGTIGGDRIEVASRAVGSGGVSSGVQAVAGNFDDPGFGIGGWIALTLGALGVGLLLVLISGGTLRTVGREISERTGRTVLVGFLALIGVPVVFVVLLISIIGIPVALLLILLVPLFSLYGMFALALVVGERLLVTFDRAQTKDVWAIVAGVLLISVIRLIPVLGWIAFAVAMLAGFGATVSRSRQGNSSGSEERVSEESPGRVHRRASTRDEGICNPGASRHRLLFELDLTVARPELGLWDPISPHLRRPLNWSVLDDWT
ncbi:MAG: hypothetical protein MUQ56_09325 [Thermoleophilia bacterium]|nr:hypothetical protein [Thermoleophilia bacterium]